MAKKCAFCTRSADSREHIFSDWMLRMLPPNERYHFTERVTATGEYRRYTQRKINLKAKVVCTSCNNTWMGDLENNHLKPAIKELLFGNEITILALKKLIPISAFMFKTLVAANHRELATVTPFFPSTERNRFRLALRIPPGVQVWIARRNTVAGKYYGFWKSSHGGTQKASYGFSIYACTWNFQNVVLQALAIKWNSKRRRNTLKPMTFLQEQRWNDSAIPIWPPPSNDVHWPPPLDLSNNALHEYSDRWDSIQVTFL
jgi:hypothetical protein